MDRLVVAASLATGAGLGGASLSGANNLRPSCESLAEGDVIFNVERCLRHQPK